MRGKSIASFGIGVVLSVACSVDRRDGHAAGGTAGQAGAAGAKSGGTNGGGHGGAAGSGGRAGGGFEGGSAGVGEGGETGGTTPTEGGRGPGSGGVGPGGAGGAPDGNGGNPPAAGGNAGTGAGGAPRGGGANGGTSSGGAAMGGNTSAGPYVTQIAVGDIHVCALIGDGRVFCWGGGQQGQHGDGSMTDSPTPVAVSGITNAVQISAGNSTTCALLADGTTKCWGTNTSLQADAYMSTTEYYFTPVAVHGLPSASEVETDGSTSCARLTNATVRCWGMTSTQMPGNLVTKPTLSNIPQLGSNSTCVILSDQTAQCWTGSDGTPATVSGLTKVTQINGDSIDGKSGGCALSSDGSVRCWGPGSAGQIGNGSTTDQPTPQVVKNLGVATRIARGRWHVCAIVTGGSLSCWGTQGMFSNVIEYGSSPLPVTGVSNVVDVGGNFANTCVLQADHTVKCWGSNAHGQLGQPLTVDASTSPVTVAGLPKG